MVSYRVGYVKTGRVRLERCRLLRRTNSAGPRARHARQRRPTRAPQLPRATTPARPQAFVDVQHGSETGGIVGYAIINGKATDVVDIGFFLRNTDKDWFKRHGDGVYGQESTQGRRVLLVDDSPFFRNMLTPLLKVAGYQVTTLDSATSALKMREDGEKFDIIVSDIEMPQMNGFEFAQKVREEGSKWLNTPMVALTSHTTEQDVHHGMEVGFSRYIAKFDRDQLLSTLTETLVAGAR